MLSKVQTSFGQINFQKRILRIDQIQNSCESATAKSYLTQILKVIKQIDKGGQCLAYEIQAGQENFISKTAIGQDEKLQKNQESIYQESLFLDMFKGCEGILQSHGMVRLYNQLTNKQEDHLLLENCTYGALQSILTFTKQFEEAAAYIVIRPICESLMTIHSKNVVHCDMKESNILISFSKENLANPLYCNLPLVFKISDFGIAKQIKPQNVYYNTQFRLGTPRYMSPQQVNPQKQEIDPFKIDVYALGVLLFKLIFKQFPIEMNRGGCPSFPQTGENIVQNFVVSSRNVNNKQVSKELEDLLNGMLATDQKQRWTLQMVQNSDWFKQQNLLVTQDKAIMEKTKQSLFSKMSYVVNLTKVKLNVKELEEAKDKSKIIIDQPTMIIDQKKNINNNQAILPQIFAHKNSNSQFNITKLGNSQDSTTKQNDFMTMLNNQSMNQYKIRCS